MKQSQNTTLMLLTVTAAVLTTLLVASLLHNQPAYAIGGSSKGGDYIMVAGAFNTESDFIYVLDIANEKLNIYFANINTNALALGDSIDLAKAFGTVPRK